MTPLARRHREITESLFRFLKTESAGGVVLVGATVLALVLANSTLSHAFHAFWHQRVGLQLGSWRGEMSLQHWINDGLMAVFFLLVGLEVKREILFGELASWRRAALPVVAALGGMLVPAGVFLLVAGNTEFSRGWGIPMATDIAFAVGVMALLGSRAPVWLKVFVTALAIADDIGAVVVIAFFYTSSLSWIGSGVAGAATLVLLAMNRWGVHRVGPYLVVGGVLWAAMLSSGIHATLAGVILGMMIPTVARFPVEQFADVAHNAIRRFQENLRPNPVDEEDADAAKEERETALEVLEEAVEGRESPLHRLERALHGWVAFGILPLFAMANAGVTVPWNALDGLLEHRLTLGVLLGLVVGKPVGVFLASFLAVKVRLGELPAGASWRQLFGGAVLTGIGFTMSIFIGGLAFTDAATLDSAKVGVFLGSEVAAVLGAAALWLCAKQARMVQTLPTTSKAPEAATSDADQQLNV